DENQCSFSRGEPVFVEDMQNDPRVQYPEAAAREGIVSMLSVPIPSHGHMIGMIRIYNSEPWALHQDDVDAFCVLAEHLGLVIENNGLRNFLEKVKMAISDLPLRMLEGL
ncbi:MAG: GAF domain-containing protein, partial [Desulfobacteraceae bacterium]